MSFCANKTVMPGLDPGIHGVERNELISVDGRVKPGHDDRFLWLLDVWRGNSNYLPLSTRFTGGEGRARGVDGKRPVRGAILARVDSMVIPSPSQPLRAGPLPLPQAGEGFLANSTSNVEAPFL
jgi:hypothetical protein